VVRQVVTDGRMVQLSWLSAGLVIKRLRNLGSTPDAEACRVSARKTPNSILGPSNLLIVVAPLDKRLQTGHQQ